ncbi:MAG: SDR family NAD(P)-dependent oxidoreductase [Acidobacteriota bacterium]
MDLAGKVCLVTGGTSGIGAATVQAFAGRGAQVAIFARKAPPNGHPDGSGFAVTSPAPHCFIQGDAGNTEDCRRAVSETVAAFGGIDVLVHAAGAAVPGGFFEIDDTRWRNAFDVHVHAVLTLAQAAVPHMMRRKQGAIVLIGSTAGERGCLGAIAYGVVKGALPQFARVLARELADHNIRVNCVSPGVIRTPFQDYLTPEQVKNNIQNRIPLHREGQPDDVARAIVELVENDFITGQDLVIDGGLTMRIA